MATKTYTVEELARRFVEGGPYLHVPTSDKIIAATAEDRNMMILIRMLSNSNVFRGDSWKTFVSEVRARLGGVHSAAVLFLDVIAGLRCLFRAYNYTQFCEWISGVLSGPLLDSYFRSNMTRMIDVFQSKEVATADFSFVAACRLLFAFRQSRHTTVIATSSEFPLFSRSTSSIGDYEMSLRLQSEISAPVPRAAAAVADDDVMVIDDTPPPPRSPRKLASGGAPLPRSPKKSTPKVARSTSDADSDSKREVERTPTTIANWTKVLAYFLRSGPEETKAVLARYGDSITPTARGHTKLLTSIRHLLHTKYTSPAEETSDSKFERTVIFAAQNFNVSSNFAVGRLLFKAATHVILQSNANYKLYKSALYTLSVLCDFGKCEMPSAAFKPTTEQYVRSLLNAPCTSK